jgi:lipid-A-disaccharide synthase-like uncharacterized protein
MTKILGLLVVLATLAFGQVAAAQQYPESQQEDNRPIRVHIKPMPEGVNRVLLETTTEGGHEFRLVHIDGSVETVDPERFAGLMVTSQSGKPWYFKFLNISSPIGFAWVLLGLMGQVLFTGRMVLQWLVSEKAKRSVVPVGFWWMSLAGASMLMVYFIWRRDVVGVLGQSAGWLIYVRNLWLIYRNSSDELHEPGR